MAAKKKKRYKRNPVVVEQAGVHIRLFKRGVWWWLDIVRGDTRQRVRAKTTDRKQAEENAAALALEIAKRDLLGVTPETLTLDALFTAYAEHKGKTLEGAWKKAAESRQRRFLAAWGPALPVVSISQSNVDQYAAKRRADYAAQQIGARDAANAERQAMRAKYAGKAKRGRPTAPQQKALAFTPRPLRDGALDGDFRWLSSVLNWACKHKLADGKRLLTLNPLHDCSWPREKQVRRPIASHERYEQTMAHANAVDPDGRLALVLTIARYTARRIDAVLHLCAADFLLSTARIRAALAEAGQDERLATAMKHGAIRWRQEHDKQGVERITPIGKAVRDAIDVYLAEHPRVGEVPAFPSVEDAKMPLSRSTATKWLRAAEQRAELPKLRGSLWHAYRRLWATERKSLPDVDVAEAGGWNGTKAMKLSYQRATAAGVLAAVINE